MCDVVGADCAANVKVAGEALLRAYAGSLGLDTVSLRYFNIFGPRQRPDSPYAAVIPRFADAFRHGKTPVVYGDGAQTRIHGIDHRFGREFDEFRLDGVRGARAITEHPCRQACKKIE